MAESAMQMSGPSLEQILWRAMDRWEERPALVDSDEFAAHIEHAFDGDIPAESWVARFFDGAEKLHKAPSDMAEAIVKATREPLQVEFVAVPPRARAVIHQDQQSHGHDRGARPRRKPTLTWRGGIEPVLALHLEGF